MRSSRVLLFSARRVLVGSSSLAVRPCRGQAQDGGAARRHRRRRSARRSIAASSRTHRACRIVPRPLRRRSIRSTRGAAGSHRRAAALRYRRGRVIVKFRDGMSERVARCRRCRRPRARRRCPPGRRARTSTSSRSIRTRMPRRSRGRCRSAPTSSTRRPPIASTPSSCPTIRSTPDCSGTCR